WSTASRRWSRSSRTKPRSSEPARRAKEESVMTDVLVVAELMEGGLRKTTLNAISAARTIAQGTGGAFDVLAIGQGAQKAATEAGAFGARKVFATEIAGGYRAEAYAATVAQAAGKDYGVVIATASTYGKDLLPRVAAKLNAGLASDI